MEGGVDLEYAEVSWDIESVGHVSGVEDKVEREREVFRPVLISTGDEVLRAEFERIIFLVRRVRDGRHLGTEGIRPHDSKMA